MEVLILLLVIGDVICLAIEHGIDRHQLCIAGMVVPVGPTKLASLAHEYHELHGHEDHGHDEHDHDEHGHDEHGHDEHGHVEHGHDAHGHDEHGHDDHALETHGHFLQTSAVALHRSFRPGLAEALAVGTPMFIQRTNARTRSVVRTSLTADDDHHHVDESLLCETRDGPHAHEVVHTLHMISIAILVVMLVEILLKLWVNTEEFLSSPWEILDLVVVSLSLIVDIWVIPMLHDPEMKSEAEVLLIILIIVRFWRVVRICHGLFEVFHKEMELRERIEELEHEKEEREEHEKQEKEKQEAAKGSAPAAGGVQS